MKKTNRFIYAFIYIIEVVFITSCSQTEQENPKNTISVNVNDADKFGDVSLFIDTDTAALYTLPDEPFISDIVKIKECDGVLYILDKQRKCLFKYTPSSDSLIVFNRCGGGPGEYSNITDFFVNESGIYILDSYANRVNVYNRNDCFIRALPVNSDVWANELFVLDEYIFLINHSSNPGLGRYHIFRIGPDGEIKSFLPFKRSPGLVSNRSVAVGDECAYYVEPSDNIIYKITANEVEPCYYVDFGNEKLPDEYYTRDMFELMRDEIDKEYSTGVDKIKYGNGLLFLNFTIKGKEYKLIYNTATETILAFCEMFRLPSDQLYGISPTEFDVCEDFVYDWKNPDYFNVMFKYLDSQKLSEPYQSQLNKLQEDINTEDNPYILKYWLKNVEE